MRVHVLCAATAMAVCMTGRVAWPQAPAATDHLHRIAEAAINRHGAYTFLQQLTDSIGGRVTGSPECRAAADLLLTALRQAGFDDAHFEEYPLESRWQRGRAAGRVVSPVDRALAVGSYGWVPGTNGEVVAPLIDLGAAESSDLPASADDVRGAVVLVDPRAVKGTPAQAIRAALAQGLARTGAAAM